MLEAAENLADIEVTDEQVDQFFEEGDIAEPEQPTQEITEQAEPEPKQEDDQPKEKFVPHGALHEERMRRKELQQQIEASNQKLQQMEDTFKKVLERSEQQNVVKYDDDPLEHLRQENEKLNQRLQQYDARFSQQDQQSIEYQRQQQFVSNYQKAAYEYAQSNPDFGDAYKYLMSARISELQAAGFDVNTAGQIATQEESMIVDKAFRDEINPAERIHALARARGFQVKAPEKTQEKTQEETKMDTLEKGMAASKTLSGGQTKGNITLESLADLSDEEFDKAWSSLIG